MSEITDQVRMLAQHADETQSDRIAIRALVQAVYALCDELDAHQHTYWGPIGLAGKWITTQSQRDTTSSAHEAYMKAQADKKKTS